MAMREISNVFQRQSVMAAAAGVILLLISYRRYGRTGRDDVERGENEQEVMNAAANPPSAGKRRGILGRVTFYDRISSNNSARVRLWIYTRGLQIRVIPVTHEEQRTEEFRRMNPLGKIPFLTVSPNNPCANNPSATALPKENAWAAQTWLGEAAVILSFLEMEFMLSRNDGQDCNLGRTAATSFIPSDPLDQAHMELVIRTHDLYLASPNCTQPGFSHTQGCMYLAPPGSQRDLHRQMDRRTRATKLREVWHQLDVLESLMRSPYFVGEQKTLADFTVYPTIVFFVFYAPRVFGWNEGAVFYSRPKLQKWFTEHMKDDASKRVRDELLGCLLKKELSGALAEIIEETKDSNHKWIYP